MSIAAYVLICLLVAIVGRHSRLGFLRLLLLSLLVTPIVTLMYVLLLVPPPPRRNDE
jgi:hypothetical protein